MTFSACRLCDSRRPGEALSTDADALPLSARSGDAGQHGAGHDATERNVGVRDAAEQLLQTISRWARRMSFDDDGQPDARLLARSPERGDGAE